MLSGDNGILQKATNAKEYTERAEIVENAKIDVLREITDNKGNDISEGQLKDVLKKYFVNSEIPEELPTNLSTIELTTLNEKYKIKVSEIYDGSFISLPKAPPLAKDKLIINPSAENDYEISPYVNYTDANGNTVLCRVLYNTSSSVEIISSDIMKTNGTVDYVSLGINDTTVTKNDFDSTGIISTVTLSNDGKTAAASYNRAVKTLNEKAESYRNKTDGIADRARSVGSNPLSPEDITVTNYKVEDGAENEYIKTYGYNNKFKEIDEIYKTDFDQMDALKIKSVPNGNSWSYYWIPSRIVSVLNGETRFGIRTIHCDGSGLGYDALFKVMASGGSLYKQGYPKNGFRSVFRLSPEVYISGGDGTLESPYELGI